MILLVALLPVAGVYGAAIASTVAYGVALVMMLLSLRRLRSDSSGPRHRRVRLTRTRRTAGPSAHTGITCHAVGRRTVSGPPASSCRPDVLTTRMTYESTAS